MSLSVIKGSANQGSPPPGVALGSSIGIGQLIIAFAQGSAAPTVSDTVNSGNYLTLANFSAQDMQIFYMVTNASGTPTVSLGSTSGYSYIWVMGVTGFLGTPTVDALIPNTATGTSTTPTIAAASNYANEIMLMGVGTSYTQAVTATGWSNGTTAQVGQSALYAIEATPTTNNFNGSWGTSQTWYVQLAGIYDLVAGVAPPSPFYYRKNVLYFI